MDAQSTNNAIEAIKASVGVFYNTAVWVIGHALDMAKAKPPEGSGGLVLYTDELQAIGVDLRELLGKLARTARNGQQGRQEDTEFWRRSIQQFVYRDRLRLDRHGHPGDPVPCGPLTSVHFHPTLAALPSAWIMQALEAAGERTGIPRERLFFRYRSTVVRDFGALMNLVRVRPTEKDRLIVALDHWYDILIDEARLAVENDVRRGGGRFADGWPGGMGGGIPMPEALNGHFLPRSWLAELLHRNTRTLARWDRSGRAKGYPWQPGIRSGANFVLYRLDRQWPTLVFLFDLGRDPVEDRRKVAKLEWMAATWYHHKDSLLEQLAEKEESGAFV